MPRDAIEDLLEHGERLRELRGADERHPASQWKRFRGAGIRVSRPSVRRTHDHDLRERRLAVLPHRHHRG